MGFDIEMCRLALLLALTLMHGGEFTHPEFASLLHPPLARWLLHDPIFLQKEAIIVAEPSQL